MSKIHTPKWVREAVRKRDKVCQHCGHNGSRKNKLTIHHIKRKATHPHLVDDLENCLLLCRECHNQVHGIS